MNISGTIKTVMVCMIISGLADSAFPENIDPDDDGSQYTYGENIGWLNFKPTHGPGVTVSDDSLTGFIWAENIGWVSLSCENTNSCATVNYGVTNDGSGNLSGYAWAENVGWINFNPHVPGDPTHYGVTIGHEGNFAGWAWGENVGWIQFQSQTPVAYKVKTSWTPGAGCPCLGDLAEPAGQVDLQDLDAMVNMLVAAGPPFIVPVEAGHCGDMVEPMRQVDLQDLDAMVNLLVGAGPPFIVPCE